MRLASFAALLLSVLVTAVAAWSKEDHEIFQLNDAVKADIGENTTFYSWIGVQPSASHKDIQRAYRKKAADLHPDKARKRYQTKYANKYDGKQPTSAQVNRAHKAAEKRFSRLSVVGDILKGEGRERYDYFLKNGFPAWRGTGYYYSRYRPGGGTVVLGLFIMMGGVAHYGALVLGHKRHKEFVDRYIRHARKMAWGDDTGIMGIPGLNGNGNGNGTPNGTETPPAEDGQVQQWNRKQRRLQEKENKKGIKSGKAVKTAREQGISTPVEAELTSGPVGAKKRVVAQNGKVLIVDSVGNVFMEEHTDEGDTIELLLDIDAMEAPTIYDTVLFKAPVFLYRKTLGRLINPAETAAVEALSDEDAENEEDAAIAGATSMNKNEEGMRRKPKVRRR